MPILLPPSTRPFKLGHRLPVLAATALSLLALVRNLPSRKRSIHVAASCRRDAEEEGSAKGEGSGTNEGRAGDSAGQGRHLRHYDSERQPDGADDGAGPGAARARAGLRRGGARHRLQEQHARRHHQGRARLRARRVRAAQVGRGQPPVDPRLRPVAQLPPAQRPALHGRHSHQHRRRLRRLPGDRPDRLPLRRGLQGRQRAAVRRQFAGRRHQFRDAHGPRRQPVRRQRRYRQLRLPSPAVELRRRQRAVRFLRHRLLAGAATASATTAGANPPAPAPTSATSSRPTSRRASISTATTSCSAFRAA